MNKFYDNAVNWLILFGPRILIAIILLVVGFWLIKKFRALVHRILLKRRVDASLRPFLTGTLSLILQVFLVFAVMQVVGIQLTIFAALIGAFGVAAGLALSGTLQNFTSGILIIILKPFRVNDIISSQNIEGTVTAISIFYTIVTTADNRTVIFPNSKLSNEIITNMSRAGRRRLDIELKLPFAIPFDKVKPIIEKTLADNINFFKEPATRVGVSSIEADGYKILINAWSKANEYLATKMKFNEELLNDINSAGIKLPEPA